MSKRAKFWLTLVLVVTTPVWVVLVICVTAVLSLFYLIWKAAEDMVDDVFGPSASDSEDKS